MNIAAVKIVNRDATESLFTLRESIPGKTKPSEGNTHAFKTAGVEAPTSGKYAAGRNFEKSTTLGFGNVCFRCQTSIFPRFYNGIPITYYPVHLEWAKPAHDQQQSLC